MKDLIKTNLLLVVAFIIALLAIVMIKIDKQDVEPNVGAIVEREDKRQLSNIRSKAQILSDLSAYTRNRPVNERGGLGRSKRQYEAHRTRLLNKLDNNLNDKVPMTFDEWQEVVELLNYELTR